MLGVILQDPGYWTNMTCFTGSRIREGSCKRPTSLCNQFMKTTPVALYPFLNVSQGIGSIYLRRSCLLSAQLFAPFSVICFPMAALTLLTAVMNGLAHHACLQLAATWLILATMSAEQRHGLLTCNDVASTWFKMQLLTLHVQPFILTFIFKACLTFGRYTFQSCSADIKTKFYWECSVAALGKC